MDHNCATYPIGWKKSSGLLVVPEIFDGFFFVVGTAAAAFNFLPLFLLAAKPASQGMIKSQSEEEQELWCVPNFCPKRRWSCGFVPNFCPKLW